jgi:type IV pilus assembly protein PilM
MLRPHRPRSVAGLVIEPGTVAAASVTVNGHIALESAAVAPLEGGVVRDGEVADAAALAQVLRDLWREQKNLPKTVRIGVANARIVVRLLDLPPLEDAATLAAAVRFHAEQELPIPIDQAVLDYQPLETIETPDGPRLRCLVVAARRELITGVVAAAREAGLKPEGVDLSAFGMVRALSDTPDPTLYVAVGGLTNLAVAADGACVFTRVSGGGLEGIAEALAARCSMPLDEARSYLFEVGGPVRTSSSLPEDDVTEGSPRLVARASLAEGIRQIAGEIRSSLDFFHAQTVGAPLVGSAVLTGPAASMPGFGDALASELGLPVECRAVELAPSFNSGVDPFQVTVAAGLAVEEGVR